MKATHWAGGLVVLGLVGAAGCTGQVAGGGAGSGGTGGGTGAGPASSSSSSSGSPLHCPPPEPQSHRATATACASTPTPCTTDADCAPDGAALPAQCVPGAGGMFCSYNACKTDADCSPSSDVCSCQGQSFGWAHQSLGNTCIPSNCHTDADCGTGLFCSPTVDPECGGFYGVFGYYCHTCQDTCVDDGDCAAVGNMPAGYCAFDPSVGHWACGYGACAG